MTLEEQARTRAIFRSYTTKGKNGKYFTESRELNNILKKVLGSPDVDYQWAANEIDTNRDGVVDEDEFVVWWCSLNILEIAGRVQSPL